MIKNDISVPIYNYIPVKRTYKGGANKYPYSAWSYGKRGFQVGSKGSSAESRAAAVKELTNNARLYSKLALTSCPTNDVLGVIGSITKAVDKPYPAVLMVIGDSGTIDHIPPNSLASKASVKVATIGSLNVVEETVLSGAFPISQVGFSEYFLDNTPYTFKRVGGEENTSGTVTFSIPVAGGSIKSIAVANAGVGYLAGGIGIVETSGARLVFRIAEVYATISIVSGGTLYDTSSDGYVILFPSGAEGTKLEYSLYSDYRV